MFANVLNCILLSGYFSFEESVGAIEFFKEFNIIINNQLILKRVTVIQEV